MVTSVVEKSRKPNKRTGRGPIEPSVMYPLPTFMELAGYGRWAMRSARRDGLFVRKANGRSYVLGSDFLEYLKKVAPKPESSSTPAGQPTAAAEPAA